MAHKPATTLRIGTLKATIWKNEVDGRRIYKVVFTKLYRQLGNWKETANFSRDDLLALAKLADRAHDWIVEQGVATAVSSVDHGAPEQVEHELDNPIG